MNIDESRCDDATFDVDGSFGQHSTFGEAYDSSVTNVNISELWRRSGAVHNPRIRDQKITHLIVPVTKFV